MVMADMATATAATAVMEGTAAMVGTAVMEVTAAMVGTAVTAAMEDMDTDRRALLTRLRHARP